jgi:hypothetical protein
MNKITKEQEEFLNKCTIGTWKVNQRTGLVDIDGSFDCSRMGLSDFMGIEFGNINGIFRCQFNRLVSLKGAPTRVALSFFVPKQKINKLQSQTKQYEPNI